MEVTIKILNGLLRGMSPSRILDQINTPRMIPDQRLQKEMAEQYCAHFLPGYSINEQQLLLEQSFGEAERYAAKAERFRISANHTRQGLALADVALYTVLSAAQVMLTEQDSAPIYHIEHTLNWREASLRLGQDLFTCAYLAWKDLEDRHVRRDFSWHALIRSDHRGLTAVIGKGLAENHQHLYGSSQTFSLSWCSLMNSTNAHGLTDQAFQKLYNPFTAVDSRDRLLSTHEKVELACKLRAYLFTLLKNRSLGVSQSRENSIRAFLNSRSTLNATLSSLKLTYGAPIPQPNGNRPVRMDYALEPSVLQARPNAPFRILAGERSFLYQCFRALYLSELSTVDKTVFYLYLILKGLFRSEMIQVNQKVGFENFGRYQDRKITLCNEPCFEAELIRMAIGAPLSDGSVTSLESRFSPNAQSRKNMQMVQSLDVLAEFSGLIPGKDSVDSGDLTQRPYFYVFHFIKKADDRKGAKEWYSYCRHENLRNDVRRKAIGLAKALSVSPTLYQRVRGIDAASNEVVCPPEVFAQAFRFLRGFSVRDFAGTCLNPMLRKPKLSITYHVGEDFLDIAGALRAVDETIRFLELRRGDRLGHGLGVGVEPELHYQRKGRKITLTNQERLDNLVWLLVRARNLGLSISADLYDTLKNEASNLLNEIYGESVRRKGFSLSLERYACSMELRGDDPRLYISGAFREKPGDISPYSAYGARGGEPDFYRKDPAVSVFYHLYHYDGLVKRKGGESIKTEITDAYLRLMRSAQDMMQREIERRGIVIECNPSSNVLIGTFQSYRSHPIFRFHNAGLETDTEKRRNCAQVRVSVNTDDIGVFDTSQQFEYELLYQTLREMKNEDGMRRCQETDIMNYLEHLREMGHESTFPPASLFAIP